MIKPDIILCDIITNELGIDASRVVVYDQNWKSPKDDDIYVVVSTGLSRIIGNTNRFDYENEQEIKRVSISTTYNIEITSKNTGAKYRKEEVLMSLGSDYSEQKQELNQMRIFRTNQILDLSFIDGPSALHRYRIPVIINSIITKETPTTTYNKFQETEILAEA